MFHTPTELRSCDAYLRSVASTSVPRSQKSNSFRHPSTRLRPRVLVIEFRDEVYSGLKSLLEEHGFEVERAALGATVAHTFNQFAPDLVLVNEDMPYESGWLITCKLRLMRHRQPVWLYTVRQPRLQADWKEFSGVDEVIEYGGVLIRLVQHVRRGIFEWLKSPGEESSQQAVTSLVA